MKAGQQAFWCGIAVCVVAGIVGGNYWVLSRFEARLIQSAGRSSTATLSEAGALLDFPPHPREPGTSGPAALSDEAGRSPQEYFVFDGPWFPPGSGFSTSTPPVQTLNEETPQPRRRAESGQQGLTPPEKLTAPTDAAPIPRTPSASPARPSSETSPQSAESTVQDERRRVAIAEELPDATPDEREIWFDQLRSMSPEEIREILRIRRRAPSLNAPRPPDGRQPHKGLLPPPSGLVHDLLLRREDDPAAPTSEDGPHSDDSRRPLARVPRPAPLPMPPMNAIPPGWNAATAPLSGLAPSSLERIQPALAAVEQARDVLLNNIANAQTVGFKRSRVLFEDLPGTDPGGPSSRDSGGPAAAGLGMRIAGTPIEHTPGPIHKTGRALDVAILGRGFFQLWDDERTVYTRAGVLSLADGKLAVVSSSRRRLLVPEIAVPPEAVAIKISRDGWVHVTVSDRAEPVVAGRIELARFADPAGLQPLGENLLAETPASGRAVTGPPRQSGLGRLRPRCLEGSNVDLDRELSELNKLQAQWHALGQVYGLNRSWNPHVYWFPNSGQGAPAGEAAASEAR